MELVRGSRLGKYVISGRVGTGGMGTVYKAFDTFLKREVAIKTIHSDKAADKDFLARFRREALAISQLEDPHIVKLHDFVEGDPAKGTPPYMVMELLRGHDLHTIIKKGPLEISRAIDRLLETCAAIGKCHRNGFIHRDLKATNIFITEYNLIEMAKVLDFGVAKTSGEGRVLDADPSEVTRKGIAVGTPEYLAPEIFRGGPGTPKTDQYSLGILLYAALTGGRKPFTAEKSDQFGDLHLWQAIMKGEHPGVRAYRSEIPAGLEAVIERAMHRDPEQRFPSVHHLGEALLPWASPRGRLQWTGHFTSTPQAVPLQPSMAIRASTRDLDPEKAHRTATGPTVPAAAARSGAQDSAELTAVARAGAREKTHGPPPESRPVGTDQAESSLSLSIEEASVASAVKSTSSVSLSAADLIPMGDDRVPVFRRPMFIVGAAGAALGVALVIALRLRGASPRTAPRTTAPDEIAHRADPSQKAPAPAPTAAPTPARAPAGASHEPVVPPSIDIAPSETTQQVAPPTEKRTSVRRHRKKPSVDQNGIGIPVD